MWRVLHAGLLLCCGKEWVGPGLPLHAILCVNSRAERIVPAYRKLRFLDSPVIQTIAVGQEIKKEILPELCF